MKSDSRSHTFTHLKFWFDLRKETCDPLGHLEIRDISEVLSLAWMNKCGRVPQKDTGVLSH